MIASHPLLLNSAFLVNLSADDRRLLGFGTKTDYQAAFERCTDHKRFQAAVQRCFGVRMWVNELRLRVQGRWRRMWF
jgi:hypothetical protein